MLSETACAVSLFNCFSLFDLGNDGIYIYPIHLLLPECVLVHPDAHLGLMIGYMFRWGWGPSTTVCQTGHLPSKYVLYLRSTIAGWWFHRVPGRALLKVLSVNICTD